MPSYFNLTLDTTAPGGVSLSLNGAAAYATARAITAAISTSDGSTSGYQMKVYGDVDPAANANIQTTAGASAWITYATSQPVTLSTGDGSKTIRLLVRDAVGNSSSEATASITLDTSVPVPTISVAASPTTISKVTGFDTSTLSFLSDSAIVAWKIKVVSSTSALENSGVVIPTTNGSTGVTGGSLAATTNQSVTIKGADLELASAGDGAKIVKIFVQDGAGNWSV